MERILPEKAMELLIKDGIEVTEEQAKIILDFLSLMSGKAQCHIVNGKKE